MLTEWMAHPGWLWAMIGGLIAVVALLATAAWQHVNETEE